MEKEMLNVMINEENAMLEQQIVNALDDDALEYAVGGLNFWEWLVKVLSKKESNPGAWAVY